MNILILVAHADDETFGMGGLLPRLVSRKHHIKIILGSNGQIDTRAKGIDNMEAFKKACALYNLKDIGFLNMKDQLFEKYPIPEIANKIIAQSNDPDLIISHVESDLNKDHRIMCEVAKIVGRPKNKPVSILGMEIANTTAWNGRVFKPDLYIDISDTIEFKKQAFSIYTNEIREFPYPYSYKGIEVLAQFRGMEAGCKYAEAYQIIRAHQNLLAI